MSAPAHGYRWVLSAPGEPLVRQSNVDFVPQEGEVVLRVLGCGICHTDLGFLHEGVRTKHPLPLALGHEVAGEVVVAGAGFENWLGKIVVLPAVLPCGECSLCRAGRETSCRAQRMPGNDFHGGFASHLVAPSRWLVSADRLPEGLEAADVAVLADAITTPYQAMMRAKVARGDGVVVIGAGGVGSFGVQIANALGARVVVADVDDAKLERALRFGAIAAVNVRNLDAKQARKVVQVTCAEAGLPQVALKVFEMSGSSSGQELAWSLMTPAGVVGIVGYSLERVSVRLSNLMAFDADAFGNWGCRPQLYAPALDLIRSGAIQVKPFVKRFPMDAVNDVLADVRAHRIPERPVLVP